MLQPGARRRDRGICHPGQGHLHSPDRLHQHHQSAGIERIRLIDAEWQQPESESSRRTYSTEIQIFANNRIGMFVDISKVFTERQIDITSMNVRTSKQGKATIVMTFDIHGVEELNKLTDKLKQIDGVLDIERTAG